MKKMPTYGSLHELLTHQFNPNKLYQFILFPTEVQHTFSHKDNRGKDVPLTKGVFPINFPYRLEHKTLMLLDKEGKQVIYKDEREKDKAIKDGAKFSPVIVRDCLGEMEILSHLQTPEKDKKHIVTTKNFTDGRITLRGTDINELKVLTSCDAFANKIDRDAKVKALFFLRDEEAYEEQLIEVEDEIFAIESYVRDMKNIDAVRAYARIVLTPTEYDRISSNDLAIIRRMSGLAKKNPKEYKEQFEKPSNLKLHYIKEAIETGIVRFDKTANALYFKQIGALILQCPFGIDCERQFADNAMTAGNIVAINNYNEMMRLLRPDSSKEEKVVMENNSTKESNNDTVEDADLKKIISIGVEKGIITLFGTAGGFYWLADPTHKVTLMGLKPLKKKLLEDIDFKEQFYALLS